MADPRCKLPENVPGEFYVDSSCIDCDTCRQLAPETFRDAGDYSVVYAQPGDPHRLREALRALVCCPTASIGNSGSGSARDAVSDFPLPLEKTASGAVYYCGFTSRNSFGGSSYLLRHPAGNWMIDSPRYVERLARRFEELGGIRFIFLTHRDDVADAERYARRFGSRRIIHRLELSAQPDAEIVLDGGNPLQLSPGFLAIPTPGHTRGHCVLLFEDRYLFAGDHLWWSRERASLNASRSVCWYSWPQQRESMERLLAYDFEWVLPGHGERIRLERPEMRRQMEQLVQRMSVK